MNRTSWPVLNVYQKIMRVVLFSSIVGFPLLITHAEDQTMTVVQQSEQLPAYKISIENPQKAKINEKTTITISAVDRETGQKTFTKSLSMILFMTTSKGTTSEKIYFRKGKVKVEKTFSELGTVILTVNENVDSRPFASSNITVVP